MEAARPRSAWRSRAERETGVAGCRRAGGKWWEDGIGKEGWENIVYHKGKYNRNADIRFKWSMRVETFDYKVIVG